MVVTFQSEANVLLGIHIKFDGIALLDDINTMVNVGFICVFYTKALTASVKLMFLVVCLKSLGVLVLMYLNHFKVVNQIVMGNFSSFFPSIPCTFHFSIDVAIVNFLIKIVMLDIFFGG